MIVLNTEQFISALFDPDSTVPSSHMCASMAQAWREIAPLPFPDTAGLNYI
jgi:hypothetical protein